MFNGVCFCLFAFSINILQHTVYELHLGYKDISYEKFHWVLDWKYFILLKCILNFPNEMEDDMESKWKLLLSLLVT